MPGIYTKLLDVDHVELVVSPYGTVLTAPAMPVVISHNMVITSLVSLNINERFHYPRYFSVTALGQHPTLAFSKGLIERDDEADPGAQDHRHRRRPTRNSPRTTPRARARTPRRPGSRSSMTRPTRPRPPISRR